PGLSLWGMAKIHPKRAIQIIALVMALGILAPSMIKLGHTFHGHWDESQCLDVGKVHIHKGGLNCDFNDHTLASQIFFASQFIHIPVEVPKPHYSNTYLSLVFESFHGLDLPPRAPPTMG